MAQIGAGISKMHSVAYIILPAESKKLQRKLRITKLKTFS